MIYRNAPVVIDALDLKKLTMKLEGAEQDQRIRAELQREVLYFFLSSSYSSHSKHIWSNTISLIRNFSTRF